MQFSKNWDDDNEYSDYDASWQEGRSSVSQHGGGKTRSAVLQRFVPEHKSAKLIRSRAVHFRHLVLPEEAQVHRGLAAGFRSTFAVLSMKSDRTLSTSAWSKLTQLWRKRVRKQNCLGASPTQRKGMRFEFLEARDVFAAGDYNPASAFTLTTHLSIFVNGQEQVIPQNVGKNVPNGDSNELFTTDTSGDVHIQFAAGARAANDFVKLDEFFDRWRRDTAVGNANAIFSSTNVLGNTVDANHVVRFYVNGVLNTDFQNYQVKNQDDITISLETTTASDAPTLLPLQNVTVLAGSPLYIPLNGFDPTSQSLTFTATSSNPSLLSTYIPQNNKTLKMSVTGFGDMVFQLFDDKASRAASRVETLASQNFYDGIIFHRVIDNFVLQAGDPTGTGTSGSTLGNFDDQFNADLQHNRTGLLSFAKTTDDTNNSQFFITEGPQRHLDSNHSIFGLLLKGENVRELIAEVPTGSGNKPLTDVVISDASVITDNQDNTLMLKAPEGASGTADVTVTVRDSDGKQFQQTFRVTITPDTTNSEPFLNDIPAINVLAGQASTFQLTSTDVEGDPVNYSIEKIGATTNYSLSVNASTGLVTVTPPTGFTGQLQARVTVKSVTTTRTDSPSDIQTFNINVVPNRIPTIDLDAASDKGASNTDNVTNATTLVINLGGLQNGDTVRLFDGATQVAEQVATGTSVAVTLNNVTAGVHTYTARTVVGSVVSSASATLSVVVDTTAPAAITTTAPTRATATEAYTYDVGSPDESAGTIQYSLTGAPTGLTIDPNTGVVNWTPTAQQTGAQSYTVVVSDPAGNTATQTVNLTVNAFVAPQAEVALDFLDLSGNVITSVTPGSEFFLRARVRDMNDPAAGISTFETDVTYDAAKVSTTAGNFIFGTGSNLTALTSGSKTTPGLLDEVGALDGNFLRTNNGNLVELFRIKLQALSSGPVLFQTDPAENNRVAVSTFASPNPLDLLAVRFGSATLNVLPSFAANDDLFSVAEKSTGNSLDVLVNDNSLNNTTNTLTISSVGTSANGATVTVSNDGKRIIYSAPQSFTGQDSFTYVVRNQNNESNTATVRVNVTNVNDPPTAVADTFTVAEDSTTTLTVLDNDSFAPDIGETLRVTAVGTTNHGGTVTIAGAGTGVVYKPAANFVGTETFSYTISDGNGGTATANVSVTVTGVNDDPTAVNDTATVVEDSSATTINVLTNDSSQPDGGETLTITSVTAGNHGGTITIASDKKSVLYTPAGNFFGEETFTYTISDGNGGTATASVTVQVTNTNDAPAGVNDIVTGYKNSTDFAFNNLLNNDTSGVDPTENLVISAVSAGSQGGQLRVSSDGKGVLYTPARDFVGTETFTYTVRDPGGLTSTATVTVNVQNYIPSKFSGAVFVDANGNGVHDGSESALSNVLITLAGKDTGGQNVNLTTRTSNDGNYSFANLSPGTYTVTQTQPMFLVDGPEHVGSAGGTAGADQFSITLGENIDAAGYNFTETGAPLQNVRITDLFARRQRNFLSAAVGSANSSFTQIGGSLWQAYQSAQLSLSNDNKSVNVLVTDYNSQQFTANISLNDTALIQNLGSSNGQSYLRILASPGELDFTKVGGGTSASAPVISTTAASINYTEDSSLVIDDGLLLSDGDSSNLSSATVTISTNYFQNTDVLEFTNQAGIVGSFNATTGTLTLQGSASVSAYQSALRSVKFRINSNNPASAARTISFSASDGSNTSATATRQITITTTNDAPVVTTSSGSTSYQSGATSVVVDSGVTVTDDDSSVIGSATVSITTGFQTGQDQLEFTTQNSISGSYNQATGVLTLTGNSSVANYQTALRSIKFRTVNSNASAGNRAIVIAANDGSATNAQSANATKTVNVSAQANVFTVNASAPNGESVGNITPTSATTGTLVYELNNGTQNSLLNLLPDDHLSGNLNGSIVMIEYFNLQCPHCRDAYPVIEAMKQQFGNDLLVVQRYFPISALTLGDEAAFAAEAAGKQGKFKEMVDLLFNRQDTWSPIANSNAPADPTATFESYATELGLNLTQFRADSAASSTAARFNRDATNATALGVTSAPTLFLNGTKVATTPAPNNAAYAAVIQPVKDGLTNIFNINHTTGQLTLRDRTLLNPTTTPTLQVPVRVTDSAGATQVVQVTVNVVANAAPVVTPSAGNTSFTEGNSAVLVDSGLVLTDVDSTNIASATVSITSGYQQGQDVLTFTDANGITGNFNAATGVLTLTGSSSVANYQSALRSVRFNNASDSPNGGNRTIQFAANDGTTASAAASKILVVAAINDAPLVTATASPLAYTENATLAVDSGLTITDVDSTNLTGATISISAGLINNEDELLFDTQNGITGTYNSTLGQLSLTGSASVANYQTALRSIRYRNNSDSPSTAARTIRFVVGDGGNENNSSAPVTRSINITSVNDPPIVTPNNTPFNYTGGAAAALVEPLMIVSDAEQNNIVGGKVTISTGYINGQDVLSATDANGITSSFNAATGELTFSGSATISQYQDFLRSVRFHTGSGSVSSSTRIVTFVLTDDGSPAATSVIANKTLNITSGPSGESADQFFQSLGSDTPVNDNGPDLSSDEYTNTADDFYSLVGA